jgi:hypothetical protein
MLETASGAKRLVHNPPGTAANELPIGLAQVAIARFSALQRAFRKCSNELSPGLAARVRQASWHLFLAARNLMIQHSFH